LEIAHLFIIFAVGEARQQAWTAAVEFSYCQGKKKRATFTSHTFQRKPKTNYQLTNLNLCIISAFNVLVQDVVQLTAINVITTPNNLVFTRP
jgi:hypothetical protein